MVGCGRGEGGVDWLTRVALGLGAQVPVPPPPYPGAAGGGGYATQTASLGRPPHYPQPIKPAPLHTPIQGLGIDMLAEALAQVRPGRFVSLPFVVCSLLYIYIFFSGPVKTCRPFLKETVSFVSRAVSQFDLLLSTHLVPSFTEFYRVLPSFT